jgi:hypothetical protein
MVSRDIMMSHIAIRRNSSDYVRINAYCGAMFAIIVVIIVETGHL